MVPHGDAAAGITVKPPWGKSGEGPTAPMDRLL